MEPEIISVISSIVINLFSSQLYDGKASIVEKIRLKSFRKKFLKSIRKYINRQDGTVLTTGDFEIFLQHYHLIENIFKHVSEGKNNVSKETFISEQIQLFHKVQNHSKNNNSDTDEILKKFILYVYDKIESFFVKNLTLSEKFITSRLDNNTYKVIDNIQMSNKKLREDIIDIKYCLLDKMEINDPEKVWSIYEKLSAILFNGRVDEVLSIWPLLEGKSKDLQSGISYLLSLFSEKQSFCDDFGNIQKNIEDNRIYNHICRISIYVSRWRNNNDILDKVSDRNPDLRHIAKSLLEDKKENFYTIEKREQNGVAYFTYNLVNNYPTEQWLVKRICMLDVSKHQLIDASESMNQLIECPDNIIDKIVILTSKILESYYKLETNQNFEKELLYREVYDLAQITRGLAKDINVIIYEMLLRSALLVSTEKAEEASEVIPDSMKEIKNIELLLLQIKLQKGTVQFDKIMNVCMKHQEYWLINNYLVQYINTCPLEMKKLIEKHLFIIDLDPSVFFIYVQLVKVQDGQDKAIELCEEYKQNYGKFLEFWIYKLRIKYSDEELNFIIDEYKNKNLELLSNETSLELVKLLIQYKRYENALEVIKKHEIIGTISDDFLYLKAIALCQTQQEIESLCIFTKLFEDGNHNEEIIYYILGLSCNNRRSVPLDVLKCAEQSNNPEILMLAANIFVIDNDVDNAFKMNIKAMLRTTNSRSQVFNQYLGIETLEDHSEEIIVNVIDVDTMVRLWDIENSMERLYVIHSLQLLPEEPYIWENAIHIYKETAIKFGLLRKKKGAIVAIEAHSYEIKEILPLEYYFFRLSEEKVIANGEAKIMTIPITKDDCLDIQKLTEDIKEVIGTNNNQNIWLNQYKNLYQFPLTFYFGKRFFRGTYFQMVSAILMDKTILYREITDTSSIQYENYIISYAALVILYRLGWKHSSCSMKFAIPEVMKNVISDEVEEIIRQNNREYVSFMGIRDDQLYFVESTEEDKNKFMQEAVEYKTYSEQFISLDNDSDLHLEEGHSIKIKDILGITDYDSINIAKRTGRLLVSAEVTVSGICHIPEINVSTINVADFLAKEATDFDELLIYVRKMVEYKCTVPFTVNTIKRISEFFEDGSEEEKKHIIEQWSEILKLPTKDEKYKSVMLSHVQDCIIHLDNEEYTFSPIKKILFEYWLIYTK